MIIKKYSSKLIAVVFGTILLFGVSPLLSSARITVTIITPIPSEIDRTWDDLDLLYDNHFHNSSEVYEEIEYIHDTVPELVDLEVIGQTYLGKDIISLRITNENRPVQKAKTLVVSHHHGREQISIEIALRFVLYLLNNYQENDTITDFIDNQEIYVIPALNLDSLDLVINEDNHWLRKNLRPWDDDNDGLFEEDRAEDVSGDGIVSSFDVFDNTNPSNPIYLYTYYEGIDNDLDGLVNEDDVGYTDLNRNYDSYWRDGVGWSPDTESQVYPGPIPFSEPETRAFRDFALNHSFGMSYSLHSGINATYFADDGYDWAEPDLYGKMVQDYSKILPSSYTEMYTVYGQNTYPEAALAGGWDTWMYFERDCLAPITFELYRNYSSIAPGAETVLVENSTHLILEWKSIYDYFNPYPQYINALWSDVLPGFDYLLDNTPRLAIIPEVLSGGYKLDDEVELSFNVTNLSPRIKTIDTIDLYTFDGTLLGNSSSIDACSSSLLSFTLTLPYELGLEVYHLKLGNNYTGYYHFVLGRSSAAGLSIGPTILGVFILGTLIVIFNRRNKK